MVSENTVRSCLSTISISCLQAQPGNSRNIGYMHHRIGGRFNKNCPCLRLYSFPDVINVGSVDKIKGKPVLSGNMPEQPMRAPIDVIGGNYMIPGGKELHQCCNSSNPGRESNGVKPPSVCHRLLRYSLVGFWDLV